VKSKKSRATTFERSEVMRRVRSKNTGPELFVQRALRQRRIKYTLHAAALPGRPDIVFPQQRIALFIHGCWWHGHACKRGNRPASTNHEYWKRKVLRNAVRDRAASRALRKDGWRVWVLWECRLRSSRLQQLLRAVQPRGEHGEKKGHPSQVAQVTAASRAGSAGHPGRRTPSASRSSR